VKSEYSNLERKRDDAYKKLDAVLADPKLKSRHNKAKSLRKETKRYWESITKMTKSVRGANHPVVAFMLREGQKAHSDRQGSSSYCTEKRCLPVAVVPIASTHRAALSSS